MMRDSISRSIGPVLAGLLVIACSAFAPARAQLLDITDAPLYGALQAHPNVAVTTSVEFPTVGAAYLNVPYQKANNYVGYFDATKCYLYSTNNNGYFYPSADAVNHECIQAFSGNFMNWVTMSAIDEFRYAMTGGNRVNESGPNGGTVIERAYLPDGSIDGVPDFYAYGSNFPRHVVQGSTVDGYASSASSAVLPVPPGYSGTVIYITNCKTQVYFGSQPTGNCGSPMNDYGQALFGTALNVRVNVCDATEGPVRTDLCLQYNGVTGKYKPVGQAQINADRMRFAAFGFLMDHAVAGYNPPCNDSGWNRCRYGGVLRAPMKYVGPSAYDKNQVASSNPKSEINVDGTQNDDPEGTGSSAGGRYSGFINYINKFGATGVYKRYDPMGEMYYEAIRYYQNLGPTPLAITGIVNNAIKDFFPVTTTWTDPLLATCAANYIINLSDANTWDDTYLPGYNGSPGAGYGRPGSRAVEGGLDAYAWTTKIGALESGTNSITTDDVRPGLNGLQNRGTGAANSASYAVAGAAYWANTNDIRTDVVGKQTIKTLSFDVAEGSIDVHDRQLYLMGKYGGFNDTINRAVDGTQLNPFYGTDPTNPSGVAIRTNAEWEDSPGSAYPANYLLASDPLKLINGLRAAFARINSQTGTLSGAALTSANLTYGSAGAYIATFDPARWSGSILYKSLSVVNGNLIVSPSAIWDAGALLTARCGLVSSGSTVCTDTDTSANQRNIVTTLRQGGVRVARDFTWANVSTDNIYRDMLDTDPSGGNTDGQGQARLNYLRGYRADEAAGANNQANNNGNCNNGNGNNNNGNNNNEKGNGNNSNGNGCPRFRDRDSAMGDIVNSGPNYVGSPTANISATDYAPFYNTYSGRTTAVYAGANDGMLHAINASNGRELFAYIPGFASGYLNDLTDPGYIHETFIDAVPSVQEVKVNGAWKTVLVAGVGGMAQGVFALDVTDPAAFDASKVLFEFSDADDPDLGNVLYSPEIVKLQTGGSSVAPTYGYFAVITGYNNRRDYCGGPNGNGRKNKNCHKPKKNKLAGVTNYDGDVDVNVSTDTNNRGVLFLLSLDRTLGTPWTAGTNYFKYYFPASDPTKLNALGPVSTFKRRDGSGAAAALYFGDLQGNLWRFNTTGTSMSSWVPSRGTVAAPQPMFVATNPAGTVRQPITARPELATGPYATTLVSFGTGAYIGSSDLSTPYDQQSEYAILDDGSSTLITRSNLQPRTAVMSGTNVAVTGPAFVYSGASAKKGWVLDFPTSTSSGERSITKPAIRAGLLTFTTLTLSSDICGQGGGFVYQLNALSGLPYSTSPNGNIGGYSSTVGIPGPPRVVDLSIGSDGGALRATGEQLTKVNQTTLVSGTTGNIGRAGDPNDPKTGISVAYKPNRRITWREITNYNDQR